MNRIEYVAENLIYHCIPRASFNRKSSLKSCGLHKISDGHRKKPELSTRVSGFRINRKNAAASNATR